MSKITTIVDNIITKVNEHTNDVTALEALTSSHINLSGITAYHLLQGNLSVSNEVITNGFSTTLYTGNGTTQNVITGVDMATQWGDDASEQFGGLVWIKSRSTTAGHALFDTVRGVNNTIGAESTTAQTTVVNSLTAFNNNGFSVGNYIGVNGSSYSEASWNFQTTHRRTGTTNHGKAFTEHYNPFTGFTIIKYEGSGLAGHEIPHSLGRNLGFLTVKCLTNAEGWVSTYNDTNNYLALNTIDAQGAGASVLSTELNVNINNASTVWNVSANQFIMYGWANSYLDETNKLIGNYEIGTYQGTGAAGNKVTTRGKPARVMTKRIDNTGHWEIYDNLRVGIYKPVLFANASIAEVSDVNRHIIIQADGFTWTTTYGDSNASGGQYLYMVVYDNDSGSGKSKYPRATDASNLNINNAIIPFAQGIDGKGTKVSTISKNETIAGLTYTAGKNYIYSKLDGTYVVTKYRPRYLRSDLVAEVAGDNPDYFDVLKNKWYNTLSNPDLVINGTFTDGTTTGWSGTVAISGLGNSTISVDSGTLKILNATAVYGASQTSINTVIGKRYKLSLNVANGSGTLTSWVLKVGTTAIADGDIHIYSTATFGTYVVEFIAQSTATYITVANSNQSGGYSRVDNVTCYATDLVVNTEIPSRNYLNHVVYADANGQLTYEEELPKIEYKDIVKANEFRGKNACTAWVNFDGTTTPPQNKDSYNILSIIRIATGTYDLYFTNEMDSTNYTVSQSTLYGTSAGVIGALKYKNKVTIFVYSGGAISSAFNDLGILIFGGKN